MSLSEKEIKDLVERAQSCMDLWREDPNSSNLAYVEKAREYYNELIKNAPPHPHYFEERSDTLYILYSWGNGSLDEAIEDINSALELNPDDASLYYRRASMTFDRQNSFSGNNKKKLLEKIITDCKTSLKKNPSNPLGWFLLMAANILTYSWDDTISYYGSCQQFITDKEDQLIRAWLGCTALALAGDPIEEEDRKPFSYETVRIQCYSIMISIASFLGENYAQAELKEKWQKTIDVQKIFIDHFDRWFDKGNMLQRLGCYEEALDAFNKELEKNPDFIQSWSQKANVFIELRRYDEARQICKKIKALDPDSSRADVIQAGIEMKIDSDVEILYKKADKLYDLCRYEETIVAYDKVIELRPTDAEAWWLKGRCFSRLDRYEEALEAANKAIDLKPDNVAAFYLKASVLFELNRHNEELNVYETIIRLEPENSFAWYMKGDSLAEMGRYKEAVKALNKAIGLSTDDLDRKRAADKRDKIILMMKL